MVDYRNSSRHVYYSLHDPHDETNLQRLKDRDRWAVQSSSDLEEAIKTLQSYRKDIAERADFLINSNPAKRILLEREKRWKGNVTYYLRFISVYPDGTEGEISCTTYPGSERHAAIKDFKEFVKTHPGIPHEMNIEKSKWER